MRSTLTALILACASPAWGDGAVAPGGSYRERTAVVENGEIHEYAPISSASEELGALPPDDAGKFRLAVFWRQDNQDSLLLARDLQQEPSLKAIAEWANTTYTNAAIAKQQRLSQFGIPDPFQPTICLFPPPESKVFPYDYVFYQHGYDGDARGLAEDMMVRLKRMYADYALVTNGPRPLCPGPLCPSPQPQPNPNPWKPYPNTPTPTPTPYPPLPNVPNIWPPDDEVKPDKDKDKDKPDTIKPGEYPEWPCITIVYDKAAIGEESAEATLTYYGVLMQRYLQVLDAKLRRVEFQDAQKQFPLVKLEDTPAAIYTERGRVRSIVPRKMLLELIKPDEPKIPVPPPEEPEGPAPPVPDDPPEIPEDDGECRDERVSALLIQVAALKAAVQQIADRGPEQGPPGPRGPRGPAGTGYELTDLDREQIQSMVESKLRGELMAYLEQGVQFDPSKLTAAQIAVLAKRLPPIGLRAKDPNTGNLTDEIRLRLGEGGIIVITEANSPGSGGN